MSRTKPKQKPPYAGPLKVRRVLWDMRTMYYNGDAWVRCASCAEARRYAEAHGFKGIRVKYI